MKSIKRVAALLMAVLFVGVGVLSNVGTISQVEAAKPKISTKKKTLNQGQKLTLKITGAKGTIKWSVNNDNVKLNKTTGKKVKVTAVKAGSSKVTANVKGKKLTCKIKVNGLNIVSKSLNVGQKFKIKAKGLGKKIKWSVSGKSVKVAGKKDKATVTATKVGKSTVIAKVGKKKYKCNVVVSNPALSGSNKVSVNASASSKIALSGIEAGTEVVWAASNSSLVKVEGSGANATVTVIGKVDKDTTVTVTATVNDKVYTWTVEVKHTHASEKIEGKEATCVEPGLTEGAKCSVCGEILVAQKEIPVEKHNTVHFEAIEPACHYMGCVEYWYCADCDGFWTDEACTRVTNSKSVNLPATGSENVVYFEAVEPACHYNGNVEYWYCADCQQYWLDEACTRLTNSKNVILPATGSDNVTHVEAKEPTTTENGNVEYWYCADCEGFWTDEACTQLTNSKNVILPATGDAPTFPEASDENTNWFMNPADITVDVAAGDAAYYQAYSVAGYNVTVTGTDAYLIVDGILYKAENGSVTVTLPNMPPVSFGVGNGGSETATYTISFAAPLGSMDNPEVIEDMAYSSIDTELAEGNSQGYNYKYTSTANGYLVMNVYSVSVENVVADLVVTNMTTYDNYYLQADGIDDGYGGKILLVSVKEGDELIIAVQGYDPETYAYPAVTIGWSSYQAGYDEYSTYPLQDTQTVPVRGNGSVFLASRNSGATMTVESSSNDYVVVYNGVEYTPVDGVVTGLVVEASFYSPAVFELKNNGANRVYCDITFEYPEGTYQNPAEVEQAGTVKTTFEDGDEACFYQYTVTEADVADGKVTVSVGADTGWYWSVSSSNGYVGENHWSDDAVVVDSETIDAQVGDVITIMVQTYEPETYAYGIAGSVYFAIESELVMDNTGMENGGADDEGGYGPII